MLKLYPDPSGKAERYPMGNVVILLFHGMEKWHKVNYSPVEKYFI